MEYRFTEFTTRPFRHEETSVASQMDNTKYRTKDRTKRADRNQGERERGREGGKMWGGVGWG